MINSTAIPTEQQAPPSSSPPLPAPTHQRQSSQNEQYKEEKIKKINQCLDKPVVDLWRLRELALTEGGFVNSNVRSRAWHKLISLDPFTLNDDRGRVFRGNRQELDMIQNDASQLYSSSSTLLKRSSSPPKNEKDESWSESSFSTLTTTPSRSFESMDQSQVTSGGGGEKGNDENMLSSTIIVALSQRRGKSGSASSSDRQNKLHYYHGFHHVAAIVLHNYHNKPALASAVLHRVAKSHFRDALLQRQQQQQQQQQNHFSLLTSLLKLVFYPLLQAVDVEVHDYMRECDVESVVILPWIVTWFAGSVGDVEAASRLFDMYFASHPIMPLYTAVALIVRSQSRREILSADCDENTVKSVIERLPSKVCLDLKEFSYNSNDQQSSEITCHSLIDDSLALMAKIPPRTLLKISKSYDQGMNVSDLRRASSITLLKAPPHWAIAASTPSDQTLGERKRKSQSSHQGKGGGKSRGLDFAGPPTVFPPEKETINTNARIASGVSLLMEKDKDTSQKRGVQSPSNFGAKSPSNFGAKSPPDVARDLVTSLFGRVIKNIRMTTKRKRFYATAE